ncbi:segregation and condensation protein B [Legionella birminghamensis]|uniref:Segregation and condensation protein B n=1 Tax=Legionella birminghamensis TaxID=28083 RepID=A0A378I9S3_9GAMM|nr:SMC-Scp complex subunit ScpB [Legionella birminghamensis]KTC74872.1 segregation and condensation protein B [Legionella birminghamensis]STX31773.1 segregation and condensation protein B [Legionella birminghamensis]
MDEINLRGILEALLMSSNNPLTIEQLQAVFDECPPEKEVIRQELQNLAKQYEESGIELKQLASGYCIQTRGKYSYWINRLNAEKPVKYSRALLETLAIIAYRQPVTRADIEEIRGVAVSTAIIKTLLERNWIRAAGYRDVPGKPAVYITTKFFLDYFNLSSIHQLPPLPHFEDMPTSKNEQPEDVEEECVES